eukprot:Skav213414  [mRNA]  locus=scaffold797:827764:829533:- [translate_table: standard]
MVARSGESFLILLLGARAEILDVRCEGASGFKWSRATGKLTLRGQTVLVLDPLTGLIYGVPLVEVPQRLGRPFLEATCFVAGSGPNYDTVLTTSFRLRIEDDTCFFRKHWGLAFQGQNLSAKTQEECQVECRKKRDCGAYFRDTSGYCFVQTSSKSASTEDVETVSPGPPFIFVKGLCDEEVSCVDVVNSNDVRLLEGQYCPKGIKSSRGICSEEIGDQGKLDCSPSTSGGAESFVMFSLSPIFDRFFDTIQTGQAPHFLRVRYQSGTNKWQYDSSSGWTDFTPLPSDVLVANITSTAVNLNANINSWYEGIYLGYAAADSTFAITSSGTFDDCALKIKGALLTFWNCEESLSRVYSREGQTEEDELIMTKEACPLPGRYGVWVARRYNVTDFVNVKTGEAELRGEAIACFQKDFIRGAFLDGLSETTVWFLSSQGFIRCSC